MKPIRSTLAIAAIAALVSGCQSGKSPDANGSSDNAAAAWPASLPAVGDGFPKAGDACRVVGETAATVNFLDDSATLVGCLDATDAAKLGGKQVGEIDGVTLVSVPSSMRMPVAGDGDGQGDAKIAGTDYNATAQVRCAGYKGAAAGMCDAGVKRGTETGTYIDVKLPDGTQRTILFDGNGKFLSFATAEADGTAAMKIGSSRTGDTTILTLGTERYELPDVLVVGD